MHVQEVCYQYWPEKEGMSSAMGKFLVTLQSEKFEEEVIERKIEITVYIVTLFHILMMFYHIPG